MTKQLCKIFRKNWTKIVSNAILLVATMGSAGSVMAAGEGLKNFVLPRYPEIYRRARIEGSFVVQVRWENGKSTVNLISHEAKGPYGPSKPDLMIEAITDALGQWQLLTTEQTEFSVQITFKLSERSADRPTYKFQIKEEDFLPREILVEADQPAIQTRNAATEVGLARP